MKGLGALAWWRDDEDRDFRTWRHRDFVGHHKRMLGDRVDLIRAGAIRFWDHVSGAAAEGILEELSELTAQLRNFQNMTIKMADDFQLVTAAQLDTARDLLALREIDLREALEENQRLRARARRATAARKGHQRRKTGQRFPD